MALLSRHLVSAGYELISERVDTPEAMRVALKRQEWDVILCDYSMPHFGALSALTLLKEIGLDIPVIIISGTIGEQIAVGAMRAGAHDYLMKDNLARLAPTIERELAESANRKARRQAEAALRKSEERVQRYFDLGLIGMAITSPNKEILEVNDKICEILGYKRSELLQTTWSKLTYPDDLPMDVAQFDRVMAGEIDSYSLDKRWVRKDGRVIHTTISVRCLRRTDGSVDYFMALLQDITERKHAEQQLRLQATALQSAANAIVITDNQGTISWVNPAFTRLTGYSSREVSGRNVSILKSGSHGPAFYKNLWDTILARQVWQGEMINRRKDGSQYDEEQTITPVLDETGEIINFIANKQAITERKRAEEERTQLTDQIENQRQRLDNIVASVPGVVWEAWGEPDAANQRINFVSDYVETMLGYSVEEWLSTPNFWLSIVHPDDREQTAQAAAADFASRTSDGTLEFRWVAKDGRILWVQSHTATIIDDEGQPVGSRGVTIDITERKRVEEALQASEDQLRQSQKLEAVGHLAGGVAHDFNNLLTVITGYSDLTLLRLDKDEPNRANVEEIKKAGQRAASLTRQLLAFSRKQVLQPRILKLNSIVSDVEKMLRRLIGEDIDLLTLLEPSLGQINADPGQIEQVILNLAVNARDAMPQGGKLTIETSNVDLDNEYARKHAAIRPGKYVMLALSDTGTGMDAETQARMFEPFFTTKVQGKGTGLGLSTVYGIVKQSEGNIWVYSELGKGTTFKVYLPRVDDLARIETAPESGAAAPQGRETVLLTEDEEPVRRLTRRILELNGYQVLEAANGDEALSIYKEHTGQIDLIVTDVVMPKMSGLELAQSVKILRPNIKVLYLSGYTDDAIVRHGILDQKMAFLQKPFTPDALLRKVREVLDATPDE